MRFVLAAFAFMGWGFYELSGGADFVPEQREVAAIEPAPLLTIVPEETPVILAALTEAAPLIEPLTEPVIADDTLLISEAVEAAISELDNETAEINIAGITTDAVIEPVIESSDDIRYVTAQRLNVRAGPSTNHNVVGQLLLGEATLVIAIAEADREWVQIRVEGDGVEGYIAARFLSEVEPNG